MAAILPFAQNLPKEIEMPYLQPNFDQIQQVAQRANGIFEQGLNQVKNDYSSVLNAPVTGDAMNERKQQYVKQFQDGLKKVASSDLTMPQNVLQAENLLQPFWSDQDMMINMDGTKTAKSNIQTIQQGLLSKDSNERDMYNPIQVQDQQDYLQELSNAGTDHNKLTQVQKRTITPFVNLTKLWNDRAKDQKLEIRYTTGTGEPYLVSTINGKQTIPNFKTWAQGQLGPDTEGMFQTIGRVAANHARQQILQSAPGMPEDHINTAIANLTYDKLDKSYNNRISGYTADIASIDKQLLDIENRSPVGNDGKRHPTANDLPIWNQLRTTKEQYSGFLKDTSDKYLTFKSSKDRTIANIATDPSDAFAQMEKDNQVENWATGSAANESIDIKPNDVYYHMMQEGRLMREEKWKEIKDRADILNNQQNTGISAEKNTIEALSKGLIRNPRTGIWEHDPNYIGSGKDGDLSVRVGAGDINADNTAPLHIENPFDNFKKTVVEGGIKSANDAIYSIGGVAGTLIDTPVVIDGKADKLTLSDVNLAHQAIDKKALDKNYVYSQNEDMAVRKLGAVVGAKDYTDPISLKTAIEQKVGKVEMNKDGTPDLHSLFVANQLANAEDMLQHSAAVSKQMDDAVKNTILHNPDYSKLKINNEVANPEKMAPYFPSVVLRNGTVLSPREVAEYHTRGIFYKDIPGYSTKYSDPAISYQGNRNSNMYKDKSADDIILTQFGRANKFGELYKQAQNQVMNNIPEAQATSGLRGFQQGYRRNEPTQEPMLKATGAALSIPSNTENFKKPDGTPVDEKDIPLLRQMYAEGDKYIADVQSRPFAGTSSGPAVETRFSLRDAQTESDKPYVELITKYPSVIVDVDPGTKNSVLQSLITAPGSTQYGDMTTGKVYSANPVMKAHNFDYEIVPTGAPDPQTGRYQTFAINGTYGYLNPETGQIEKRPIRNNTGQVIQGAFAKQTPYQVIQSANQQFKNTIEQNIQNYEYYKSKNHNTPSYDQLEAQYQNQR